MESLKMKVEPKVKGFICTTAHPEGCEALVKKEIEYVESIKDKFKDGPKNVLIIGASQGFGLSARIVSTFGYGANTLGIFFEKPATGKRTASSGWYKTVAFEKFADEKGIYNKSINGDAFSDEVKDLAIKTIKEDMGKIDLVIYSLAAPRRKDPKTGKIYNSSLKTLEKPYTSKTIDINTKKVYEATLEPATEEEIEGTVKVMGGEDWQMWIEKLIENDLLSEGAITVAFTYIGPKVTFPMYREGTIGKAKEHLEKTADILNNLLNEKVKGQAFTSVNKALVTQASSAIPFIPLYISILYKVMKEKGTHEGTIEQMARLFYDRLYREDKTIPVDDQRRIRIDDYEMSPDVQEEVSKIWEIINSENVDSLSDIDGYIKEFYNLYGFKVDGVDYSKEIEVIREIKNIIQ